MSARCLRRSLVVALVLAACWATPSRASSPVDRQAWTRTSAIPTFVAREGHIYVAGDVGSESTRSFLHVDLGLLPTGAETGIVLTLSEDGGATAFPENAAVVACPLTSPLVGSGELSADASPAADCERPVALTRRDGAWSVALDRFLSHWRSGHDLGLALIPVPSATSTFRLAFDISKTSVTLPPASSPEPVAMGAAVTSPPASTAAGDPVPMPSPPMPVGPEAAAVVSGPATPEVASAAAQPARAGLGVGPANAAWPAAGIVLGLVGVAAAGGMVPLSRRRPRLRAQGVAVPGRALSLAAGAAALLVVPSLLAEATVYKFGLVLIVLVGAIGLHLLVNWAGELSLAHAALVGLPAFAAAKLSADHGWSPIVLLPVAVVVGLVAGAVLGIPSVRARGLQVALVTLAGGVAIERFFFTRDWLVGDVSGVQVASPRLGPITFASSRALYPLLAVLALAAVGAAWVIYRSKLGRGLLWVKAQPDAAAAFGIPVGRYRTLAYSLAGGFAGLSGGLTAMWVQRLTPQAFPLSRSFTYLIIVALAGRGFLGGVAAAAAMVEGGRLFLASGDAFITYAAPLGLILTLTQHRAGLNGLGRQLGARLRSIRGGTAMSEHDNFTGAGVETGSSSLRVRPIMVAGATALALGATAIVLAWYHAGNTNQVWIQNQELISGGIGGLSLVIVGVALLAYDRFLVLRALDAGRWERLLAAVEAQAPGSPAGVVELPSPPVPRPVRRPARRTA